MLMDGFFRFPHTSHLVWLGEGPPRGDKVLDAGEVRVLFDGNVLVEEKVDGANLGLSLDRDGGIRVQNRGQYLAQPFSGQFSRLSAWLAQHEDGLRTVLQPELILFGEWMAARHSLDYTALPDWFLLFDVYDRSQRAFWSAVRRNELADKAGVAVVPCVFQGHTTIAALQHLVNHTHSRFRNGQPLEGVVVRRDGPMWNETRAKLVRPDFTQAIGKHWRGRSIEWNHIYISNRADSSIPM